MRRFLILLLLLAVLTAIGGVFWVFFVKKDQNTGKVSIELPSNPFGTPGIKENPNGQGNTTGTSTSENLPATNPNNSDISSPLPVLEKVWSKPVAGYAFTFEPIITTSTSTDKKGNEILLQVRATSSLLLFVEKETGNIYKKTLETGSTTRITNTTILGVYDAYFLLNGRYVVMRTYNQKQKTVQTFVSSVPNILSFNDPVPLGKATFLENNITSLIPSYTSDALFYLVPTTSGSKLYTWNPTRGSQVLTNFPLKELLLSVSSNNLYLTTKASALVKGYVLSINTSTLYGGKTGLTTAISPNNEYLLSSMWSSKGLVTFVHSLSLGKDRVLSLTTLAEKCVWDTTSSFTLCAAPDLQPTTPYGLPDDWYKGVTHFKDNLYLVGVKVATESKLLNLSETAKTDIDFINPLLNPKGDELLFTNKNDNVLWIVHIGNLLAQ